MNGTRLFALLGEIGLRGVEETQRNLREVSEESERTARETRNLGATYTELQDDVKASETRLKELKDQYSNVVLQQGKNSDAAKELEAEMRELNKGLETDKKRLKEAEQASDSFTTSISKNANEVKTASEKLKEAGDIAGELGKKMAIGIAGIGTAVIAGVESTREFRQDLGKLQTTFQETGSSSETATKVFKEFYGLLGEDDTSIEAANHLAMMTNNEKDLEEWTRICTGVYATFGDSLPLEGLTEAANETARVGQVTGPLADALNWAGESEEAFNEKLLECNSTAEREALIRETLTGLYGESADTFRDMNGEIIDANKAQADLSLSTADLNNKLEPLVTKGKELLTEFLEKAMPFIEWFIDNLDVLGPIILTVVGALTLFSTTMSIVNAVMMASPVTWIVLAIVAAIAALVAIIVVVVKHWDDIKEATSKAVNKMKEVVSEGIEKIKGFFEKIINFIKDNWQALLLFIVNPFAGAFKLLYDNCDGFREFIDKWIKKIKDFFVNGFNTIKDKVVSIVTNLTDGVKDKFNSFKDSVSNIFNKIKTGITTPIEKARDIIKGIVDKIKGFFDFEFKTPKIKTPKFSISPSGWKVGDLLDGVIPKLGITWNAEGAIFSKPTIFNTSNGMQGVGEAGPEAIAPISKLMDYTRLAVDGSNEGLESKLDVVINILQYYLPLLKNMKLVLDTGELVGGIVDPMDKALAEKENDRRKGR